VDELRPEFPAAGISKKATVRHLSSHSSLRHHGAMMRNALSAMHVSPVLHGSS